LESCRVEKILRIKLQEEVLPVPSRKGVLRKTECAGEMVAQALAPGSARFGLAAGLAPPTKVVLSAGMPEGLQKRTSRKTGSHIPGNETA
jgi:hypothetical protein